MSDKVVEMEITKDCCPTWACIADGLGWMVLEDVSNRKIMPHIEIDGTKWRVNHCPSCGAERRDVVNFRRL